jgi:putative copper resistance protein D
MEVEMLASARAVHFAGALLLFGNQLSMLLFRLPRASGKADRQATAMLQAAWRRQRWLSTLALVVAVVSGIGWFACVAADVSGLPLRDAWEAGAFRLLALETSFGRAWIVRAALGVAVALCLIKLPRTPAAGRRVWLVGATVLSGALLALLASSGHALAAASGVRSPQFIADVLHLLAAGAWLGGLPGLVLVLHASPGRSAAVVRRFSVLGMVSVALIVVTGFVNAQYLVGTLAALVDTVYGRLLVAKLVLVAGMVALAGWNRAVVTPGIDASVPGSESRLARNAMAELALGAAVIAIVGLLGVTVPGSHAEHADSEAGMAAPHRH